MARKHLVRFAGDVREHPRYSIEEAAAYLRIPKSTLKAWARGQRYFSHGHLRVFRPVLKLADARHKLLSFYNLAEAHVLRSTTEKGVPLRNVRRALEYLREQMPTEHPLLSHDFETSGASLFVQHLGQTVNATRHGQVAMREVLERYLQRVERDKFGMPTQFRPIHAQRLAINAQLSSGKPVVFGTGINVSVLADRAKAGEPIPELAEDYGLTPSVVTEAIQEYAAA